DEGLTSAVEKRIRNTSTADWIYVSPKNSIWTVRLDGRDRALRVYKHKATAISAAKRIVEKAHRGNVIVYNSMGEILKVI
ncbi:MAG: DUF2188 domain-containing protein, partial [Pedobacter sp.]